MWMATCTRLAPKTLYQGRKHHNIQTLSAVSCQRSAVSCRSFCARCHAFGTSPAFLKHHYLHAFSTTDTTSTTTTTTHPITVCHTHTHHRPCSTTTYIRHPLCLRSASIIYQTHTIFPISHHYLSDTCSISEAPFLSLFTRFQRAPPNSAICTLFYDCSHTAHTT